MKKIPIIIATQRTGGSFLFLHFFNEIQVPCFEPFNSVPQRKEMMGILGEHETKNRNIDPVSYLRMITVDGPAKVMFDLCHTQVRDAIARNANEFNSVYLYRKNIVKQFISYKCANRSNKFLGTEQSCENPLVVDIDEMMGYCARMNAVTFFVDNAFKNVKRVAYEDLSESKIKEIAEFFEIEISHKPKTKKMHTSYDFIVNKEEINKEFPGWEI